MYLWLIHFYSNNILTMFILTIYFYINNIFIIFVLIYLLFYISYIKQKTEKQRGGELTRDLRTWGSTQWWVSWVSFLSHLSHTWNWRSWQPWNASRCRQNCANQSLVSLTSSPGKGQFNQTENIWTTTALLHQTPKKNLQPQPGKTK